FMQLPLSIVDSFRDRDAARPTQAETHDYNCVRPKFPPTRLASDVGWFLIERAIKTTQCDIMGNTHGKYPYGHECVRPTNVSSLAFDAEQHRQRAAHAMQALCCRYATGKF